MISNIHILPEVKHQGVLKLNTHQMKKRAAPSTRNMLSII